MILPKGTRIIKCRSQASDGHKDGAKGVIVRVTEIPIEHSTLLKAELLINPNIAPMPDDYVPEAFYYVEWDDMKGIPVGICDYRIKPDTP